MSGSFQGIIYREHSNLEWLSSMWHPFVVGRCSVWNHKWLLAKVPLITKLNHLFPNHPNWIPKVYHRFRLFPTHLFSLNPTSIRAAISADTNFATVTVISYSSGSQLQQGRSITPVSRGHHNSPVTATVNLPPVNNCTRSNAFCVGPPTLPSAQSQRQTVQNVDRTMLRK